MFYQYIHKCFIIVFTNTNNTFQGVLDDGNMIAVKIFHDTSLECANKCYSLYVLASKLQHENIAKVLGYTKGRVGQNSEQKYILIEEYIPKGTLRKFIYEQGMLSMK